METIKSVVENAVKVADKIAKGTQNASIPVGASLGLRNVQTVTITLDELDELRNGLGAAMSMVARNSSGANAVWPGRYALSSCQRGNPVWVIHHSTSDKSFKVWAQKEIVRMLEDNGFIAKKDGATAADPISSYSWEDIGRNVFLDRDTAEEQVAKIGNMVQAMELGGYIFVIKGDAVSKCRIRSFGRFGITFVQTDGSDKNMPWTAFIKNIDDVFVNLEAAKAELARRHENANTTTAETGRKKREKL